MLRRVLTFLFFMVAGVGFWLTWPGRYSTFQESPAGTDMLSCQENLRRISLAFAQYAEDFDGKFPRGVDPEDQAPQTWQSGAGGKYSSDALTAPRLVDLLQFYLHDTRLWRCPADNGWTERPRGFESRLGVVKPSSWERFDTSYYYYTIHGFAGLRADDIPDPARDLVLFDGYFWHDGGAGNSLNALFADGHVENLSPEKFDRLGSEQSRMLPK